MVIKMFKFYLFVIFAWLLISVFLMNGRVFKEKDKEMIMLKSSSVMSINLASNKMTQAKYKAKEQLNFIEKALADVEKRLSSPMR